MSLSLLALVGASIHIGAFDPPHPAGHVARPPSDCSPVPDGRRPYAINELVDSAGVLARLQALDPNAKGEVIVSVLLSKHPTGHIVDPNALLLEPAMPLTPAQDSLVQVVLAALRKDLKDAPPAFRLRMTRGESGAIARDPAVLCAPVSLETAPTSVRGSVRQSVRPGGAMPVATEPRPVAPKFRVTTSGKVADINLNGGTGMRDLDIAIRDGIRQNTYRPALLDGRPVDVWMQKGSVELAR